MKQNGKQEVALSMWKLVKPKANLVCLYSKHMTMDWNPCSESNQQFLLECGEGENKQGKLSISTMQISVPHLPAPDLLTKTVGHPVVTELPVTNNYE